MLALFCLTFIGKASVYVMDSLQWRMKRLNWRPLTASYIIDVVVKASEHTSLRMQVKIRSFK
jgi:hypothetical protein